jgi:hypothetical protein
MPEEDVFQYLEILETHSDSNSTIPSLNENEFNEYVQGNTQEAYTLYVEKHSSVSKLRKEMVSELRKIKEQMNVQMGVNDSLKQQMNVQMGVNDSLKQQMNVQMGINDSLKQSIDSQGQRIDDLEKWSGKNMLGSLFRTII